MIRFLEQASRSHCGQIRYPSRLRHCFFKGLARPPNCLFGFRNKLHKTSYPRHLSC